MDGNPRARLVVTVCGTCSYHRTLNGKFGVNEAVVICVEAVFVKSAMFLMFHTSKQTKISESLLMILLYVWMFVTAHTMTETRQTTSLSESLKRHN